MSSTYDQARFRVRFKIRIKLRPRFRDSQVYVKTRGKIDYIAIFPGGNSTL